MDKKFATDIFSRDEANIIVFGVPFGKFLKKAPDKIREVSWFVESFDVDKKTNLLENIKIFDDGNLKLNSFIEIENKVKEILDLKKIPLLIGGGHLLSLYSLQQFPKNTKVIVFDAHGDLKDEYIDEKIEEMDEHEIKIDYKTNDATWLRRFSEKNTNEILHLGGRSWDENEVEYMLNRKIRYFTSNQIKQNLDEVKKFISNFSKNSDVYISLDIDVFDPSVAPAVDYPEPSGIFFSGFKELVNSIKGKVVGMDVSCLRPIENDERTEFLTVKAIFEILGIISKQAGVP